MMAQRRGRLPPRRTVALFIAVAAVSVAALVWMGARLLVQDRALEGQRLQERRETAADRVVAALEQALLAEERRLAKPPETDLPDGDDALVVVAGPADIRVSPEKALLFYPVVSAAREAPAELFSHAERLEFGERDYMGAMAALRPLARSADPNVRAGAQLRLARNLRKAGHSEEALAVFGELRDGTGIVSGLPASLVGRSARCLLLEELGRHEDLRQEAGELRDGLAGARWKLDRDTYLYYSRQTARWLSAEAPADDGRQALTEGVCWLWDNLRPGKSESADAAGRRSQLFLGTPVTILWRISDGVTTALVAGPHYQQHQWFDPVLTSPDFSSVRVSISERESGAIYGSQIPSGLPAAVRAASATTLPWDVSVTTLDPDATSGSFAQRRRLMIFGLALVVLFVVAATYFVSRAVSRELAAATLQSDFVSAVSHEFRTPLTSMKQFTEMLVDDDDVPAEERREFYRAQERATRRLSRLVESLLDFGRMEAGARPYRLEPLDAADLVRTVVEEFRHEGGSSGFSIECAIPETVVPINGDREALAQALWNLLDNAVKYSGDSRTVQVKVDDGDRVSIRVRDHGLGITPAEQRRIFDKFARGSSAVQAGIKGTGIGLAMVRHIVDAHGGKVMVDSEPGHGSTFTIELPTRRGLGPGTGDQG
jgi:signal transduction histidine kinase